MAVSCQVDGFMLNVIRVSRVFGLAPVTIKQVNNKWRITISKYAAYYGYILYLFLFAVTLTNVALEITLVPPVQGFSTVRRARVMYFILSLSDFFFFETITGIGCCYSLKRFTDIIKNLDVLKKLSDDKKNKSRFIIVMFYVGVRSFFLCMGTLLRYQETDSIQRFLMHTFVEAHHLLISLLEIQMICIGYAVQRTLNSIVQELSKLRSHVHRDQRDRAFYSLSSLQTSAKTFTDTCEVMERVNACHGCLVLLFIALYTHHIIFTADSLAYFLTHADIETAKFFGKCSLDVMWLLYHIIRAVIFVHPWHGMTQEVDKIKIELCKILQRTSPDDIEMMWGAKVLYMELMIKKPELKPLGLFTVSRSLLVEIIGVVITYTVVVVQLRN